MNIGLKKFALQTFSKLLKVEFNQTNAHSHYFSADKRITAITIFSKSSSPKHFFRITNGTWDKYSWNSSTEV